MLNCTCKDWAPSLKIIDSYIMFGLVHGWPQYNAPPFVYCPWCGGELERDREEEEDVGSTAIEEEDTITTDTWYYC